MDDGEVPAVGVGLRSSQARLYRQGTAVALAGAPLLFLVANILHPEEFKRDHEAEQLAAIASSYTTWQLAHLLTFGTVILFSAAVLGLAYLVRRRRPTAGLVFGAMALVGLFGLAFVDALDGYTWGILGEVSAQPDAHAATVQLALHDMQQSTWSIPYYMTPVLFVAGVGALALHAAGQGAVPLGASLLLTVGALLAGAEGVVQDNAFFIVASSVLVLGAIAVAAALWQMSDDEFDAGTRHNPPRGA
jgi:hypothetical protein